MANVCILTDSSVQFSSHKFQGEERVRIIPFEVNISDGQNSSNLVTEVAKFPDNFRKGNHPTLRSPDVEQLMQAFISLGKEFEEIVAIFLSSNLNPIFRRARNAKKLLGNPERIEIIDSQSTAVGLGWIVEMSAKVAELDWGGKEIRRMVMGQIPHTYSVFCLRSLSYLSRNGYLDPAQAIVGDMLNMKPFFILEQGHLVPIQKIRSSRNFVDTMCDFVSEFEQLNQIGIIQGFPPFDHEKRAIRERLKEIFPETPFIEHHINPVMATIFGPRTFGLFTWEQSGNDLL